MCLYIFKFLYDKKLDWLNLKIVRIKFGRLLSDGKQATQIAVRRADDLTITILPPLSRPILAPQQNLLQTVPFFPAIAIVLAQNTPKLQ